MSKKSKLSKAIETMERQIEVKKMELEIMIKTVQDLRDCASSTDVKKETCYSSMALSFTSDEAKKH